MNGFIRGSRKGLLRRYQYAGSRAVRLELREQWMEAAEAWQRAAYMAPRTDWQQFARKRAEHCHRRCRGRV
ncbi:hypothetical protein HEP22_015475 [Escherichia coli]|uniref:hypothetical protein n=1 Tax=Escherichia coli TaxID=562 RepID=UPI00079FFCE4|nr:hypothetical protein [Escherichia coli]EEQ8213692.1 hypothetical protein [Escherichia coli]EEV5694032.1 hypothetical protein [Escherichia coli]EFB8474905.1 hypothetical protein [Escherichia coli]EFC7940680.1 hypothetical protein [Escherichia coli]EFF6657014.1 hypothetical protein [Escherichia coli]